MKKRKKVTLQDIADALNVSFATVSNALNQRAGVSSEVRELIFEKAQELGYQRKKDSAPINLDLSLKSRQNTNKSNTQNNLLKETNSILYVDSPFYKPLDPFESNSSDLQNQIEDYLKQAQNQSKDDLNLTNLRLAVFIDSFFVQEIPSFYLEIFKNIIQCCNSLHYSANLIPVIHNSHQVNLDSLNGLACQGVIVIGQLPLTVLDNLKTLFNVPFVILDHYDVKHEDITYIALDSFIGMYSLVKDIIKRGYTDLCFVGSIDQTNSILDRYLGYIKAMTQSGLKANIRYLEDRNFALGPDLNFKLPENLPQLFVCNCDKTANLVIKTLQEKGLKVPQDVAVVGFDNYGSQINSQLKVFTFDHNPETLAKLAINAIIAKLENKQIEHSLFIEGQIVAGNSILESFTAECAKNALKATSELREQNQSNLKQQNELLENNLNYEQTSLNDQKIDSNYNINEINDDKDVDQTKNFKSNTNPVKLQDIAKALNTSTVTVSNALAGREGVSEDMRTKIVSTAQKMGYVPRGIKKRNQLVWGQFSTNACTDRLAQVIQLGMNSNMLTDQLVDKAQSYKPPKSLQYLICVVVARRYLMVGGSFYWELYQHMISSALNYGFTTTIAIMEDQQIENDVMPDALKLSHPDGLIAMGPFDTHYLQSLSHQGIPCIQMDYCAEELKLPAVLTNNYINSYKITQHLIDHGHKEIGFIGSRLGFENISDRFFGYQRAMIQNHLNIRDEWIIDDRDLNTGKMYHVLNLPEQLPSAFVCNCDSAAYILYSSLRSKGIKVPEDISLVGYDNYLYGVDFANNLTTIDVNLKELSKHSIDLMMAILNHQKLPYLVKRLECKIIQKNSVKTLKNKTE